MRAAEKGVTLTLDAKFELFGATSLVLYIIGPGTGTTKTTISLSVPGVSSQTVDYVTVGTEFPTKGEYVLQLEANYGALKKLKSPTIRVVVEPVLT